jgi:transposase
MLAAEKHRLHTGLSDAGLRRHVLGSDRHGQAGRALVKAIIADRPLAELLTPPGRLKASREERFEALPTDDRTATPRSVRAESMAPIEALEARLRRCETALREGLAPWRSLRVLLQTLPGIDHLGAAMLRVEIGTARAVFGRAGRRASGVGSGPGNHESAGQRNSGKPRQGNAGVRRLLGECAQAAARRRCALKDKFTALTIRKGHQKAIVALAHKRLRIIDAMRNNHTAYQDRAIDDEAMTVQRNAPRWINMWVQHGVITPATA